MATIKEDYEIITNLIRQEIDKRKKQKQIKENLKNIEEDISLINKTEKKIKKKKKKSKTSAQLITISPNEKSYIKIDDYNDKYLNKDKTECVNEPMLLKKKKKKKKGEKKKVQNDIHLKTYNNVTLKGKKIYSENCDDNEKHLKKEKLRASYLNKEILTSCIPIANALEVDKDFILLKKKKKKKKEEKKKVQNDIHLKNYNTILKAEKQTINNTEKLRSCIPIVNALEVDKKCILSKRKKKKMKKGVIEVQTEKNDNATLKAEKLYINTCYDNDKYLNKKNTEASGLIKDELTSRVSIANDLDGNKELTLFKKKKKKKHDKKKLQKYMKLDNDNATLKIEKSDQLQSNVDCKLTSLCMNEHKKAIHKVDMNKTVNSINMKTSSINYEEYITKFHKLLKIQKKEQRKAIKSVSRTEKMLIKKSNKHKRLTINKEYLKNDSPKLVDMDKETYDNNDRVASEDSRRNLDEIIVPGDNRKSKYRTMADTDLYFSRYCKELNNANSVSTHENVNIGKSPLVCDVCFKPCISKSKLCVHIRTHTGEKPYACKVCGRSFSHKSSLVEHIRTHTGEKPYACKVCGRSFTQQSHLVVHIRTHTGEKPYACKVCGRSFTQQSHLVEHIRTHTGEKPYACKVCGRSFSQNHSLVEHNRTHTGERPYECGQCEKKFISSGNRTSHIRNIHFKCF